MYKPVVVALNRELSLDLERQLERIMHPFTHEPWYVEPADDECSPTHRCDGWRIGGRWSGRYLSSVVDDPDLVNSLCFPKDSPLAGYVACDGGPKRLLDLERVRRTAGEEAWLRWPRFVAERRGGPGFWTPRKEEPLHVIRAEFDEYVEVERARAVTGADLVTHDGEWIDGDGGPGKADEYFRRAGEYIDKLDDDAWLVCLTVHF